MFGFLSNGALVPPYFFNNKIWLCNDSLAITIPTQVTKMHHIEKGDYFEFNPIGSRKFKV